MQDNERKRGERAIWCLNKLQGYLKESHKRAEDFLEQSKIQNGGKIPNEESNLVRAQQMTIQAVDYQLKQYRKVWDHKHGGSDV